MRELSMSFSWLCATHFFHLSQKLAKLIHRIHIYNSASTGAEKNKRTLALIIYDSNMSVEEEVVGLVIFHCHVS